MSSPTVSVIIPVWNGEASIAACIEAVLGQVLPGAQLEVIVVDNGSTDGTAVIVERYEGVRLLREQRPGSYAARNLGLLHARGEYVAFTDADCVPSPDWLAAGLSRIKSLASPGIVAGPIDLLGSNATPMALAYERVFAFRQHLNVPKGNCVTANWLSPRAVLQQFGGFDADLFSGGDWKLSSQIRRAGYDIVFEPKMLVQHPPREALGTIIEKRRRIAGGKTLGLNRDSSLPSLVAGELRDALRKGMGAWSSKESVPMKIALSGISCWIGVVSAAETWKVRKGQPAVRR